MLVWVWVSACMGADGGTWGGPPAAHHSGITVHVPILPAQPSLFALLCVHLVHSVPWIQLCVA